MSAWIEGIGFLVVGVSLAAFGVMDTTKDFNVKKAVLLALGIICVLPILYLLLYLSLGIG